MSYQTDSPQVYAYGNGNVQSSFNQQQPLYTTNNGPQTASFNQSSAGMYQPPALNRYGESQIETVFAPIAPTQSSNTFQSNHPNSYGTENYHKMERVQSAELEHPDQRRVQGSNVRFDTYLNKDSKDYKYNVFSVMDEPWNKCTGRQAGGSSGCECLPNQTSPQHSYNY